MCSPHNGGSSAASSPSIHHGACPSDGHRPVSETVGRWARTTGPLRARLELVGAALSVPMRPRSKEADCPGQCLKCLKERTPNMSQNKPWTKRLWAFRTNVGLLVQSVWAIERPKGWARCLKNSVTDFMVFSFLRWNCGSTWISVIRIRCVFWQTS